MALTSLNYKSRSEGELLFRLQKHKETYEPPRLKIRNDIECFVFHCRLL